MTECIEFQGHRDAKGYGGYGSLKAHRVEYAERYGPILNGMHVLHRCGNPACINTDHLFLGTNMNNVQDRVNKGRSARQSGETNGRAVLTADQVAEIKERLKHYKRGMVAALAREYNVRPERISHIKTGRTWT